MNLTRNPLINRTNAGTSCNVRTIAEYTSQAGWAWSMPLSWRRCAGNQPSSLIIHNTGDISRRKEDVPDMLESKYVT